MSDPLYPKSGAYHEAGHIVVAAAQGMLLSIHGVHVDRDGKGISFYDCRKPEPVRREFDKKGEHTIISLFAGLIAQQTFHTNCSTAGSSEDKDWIERLLAQMYLGGTSVAEMKMSEVRLNETRQRLREEARQLVNDHWTAIDTLAKALWEQPSTPRLPDEPEKLWSPLREEKTIDGAGIAAILKKFGICAALLE
jgi:hypothetical protein